MCSPSDDDGYRTKTVTDISSGQPIARGRTADIYTWEDGYMLKLSRNWLDPESIQYEAQLLAQFKPADCRFGARATAFNSTVAMA
jgi:hypothetical protein